MKVLVLDHDGNIHRKYSKNFKDLGLSNITYISEIDNIKIELFDIVLSDGIVIQTSISIPIIVLCDFDKRTSHNKDCFFLETNSTAEDIVRTIKVLSDSLDWAMEFYNYKSNQNQNFKVNIENVHIIIDQILELFPDISTSRIYLIMLELCYIFQNYEIIIYQDKNCFKLQIENSADNSNIKTDHNIKINKNLHISPYICDNLLCENQKITVEIRK